MITIYRHILLIMLGGILPSVIFASDYLLITPFYMEDKAWACDMDTSGNLSFRKEYTIGFYPNDTAVTDNGRLAIISSYNKPDLSCFFIDKNFVINDPIYYDLNEDYWYTQVIFNPFRPVGYIGTYPQCRKFMIDYPSKKINITTDTATMNEATRTMGYSKYSNCLVNRDFVKGIKTTKLLPDGSFSSTSHTLEIPWELYGFCVSPDGRFVASIRVGNPKLIMIGINEDGSLYHIQQLNFTVKEAANPYQVLFTPNGRYLIMTCAATPNFILCFSVNQKTGEATWIDTVKVSENPPLGYPGPSAITPDGKYLLYVNAGIPGYPNVEWHDIFRIEENGKLTWLKDKKMEIQGGRMTVDKMFVPPWRETVAPPHGLLAH